jgi:hypothetical protein
MIMRSALVLAIAAALAACASRNAEPGAAEAVAALARSATGAAPAVAGVPVASGAGPLIQARLEKSGAEAPLAAAGANAGMVTFVATNGVALALRGGVLVQTRGLGPDLMSSEAPSAATISGGSGTHPRRWQHLDGLGQTVTTDASCRLEPGGRQSFELGGAQTALREVVERCDAPGMPTIVNGFWFDAAGRLRLSRQWIGPDAGHVAIAHLSR